MTPPEDYQNSGNRSSLGRRISPVPFPEDVVHDLDKSVEGEQARDKVILPRLRLPVKSIDQWPTQVNMYAIDPTILQSYSFIDPLWNIPTGKLPSIVALSPGETANDVSNEVKTKGYSSQLQKLVKNSGVYAFSSLATPLVSLVLAPFLTRNLSHNEYGALAVMTTAIALMAGLTQFGLGSAFFRSYNYDYEAPRDRLGVLSTVVVLLLLTSIPVIVATMSISTWLSVLLFNNPSFSNIIRVGSLVVLMQNLTIPGFAWLRAENRPVLFSALAIANLTVSLIATLVLVGVMHLQVIGSLLATGIGYATVVICILPLILLRAGIYPRLDIARGLVSFGLPNVFNFVSVWVLQLSDRYLLSHLGSLSQTASYSLAYNLGGILGVVVLAPFNLAWPAAMFTIAKRKDATGVFQMVFRWFSLALLLAAFGLSILSALVLNLFFPASYYSATSIIPVIAFSIMFYGVYNIFMTGVSIRKKTWFAVILTTMAAIINILLNLFLIPLYGSFGAAASTFISYLLLAISAYFVNQRLYPIHFEIGRFTVAFFIGVALYAGCSFLAPSPKTFAAWGTYGAALLLYAACLALLAKLPGRR